MQCVLRYFYDVSGIFNVDGKFFRYLYELMFEFCDLDY